MINVVVVGGGGLHGYYCISILEQMGCYKIVGICDAKATVGSEKHGYPVIGRQEELPILMKKYDIQGGLISLGDNFERYQVSLQIKQLITDFQFINAIHPSAVIGKDTVLGEGVVVGAGGILGPGCDVGDFCLIGNNVSLGVDNRLAPFVSFSTGACSGGKVMVDQFSAITMAVTLIDRLRIGLNTVVGSGSLVLESLPDNVLAYGVPAKIIGKRQRGERFLN